MVSADKALLKLQNQKNLVVSGAFPEGYPGQEAISFTVQGVTNPSSTKPTQSFSFKLYYVKDGRQEMIDSYDGDLLVEAEPSEQITLSVALSADGTGQLSETMTIRG